MKSNYNNEPAGRLELVDVKTIREQLFNGSMDLPKGITINAEGKAIRPRQPVRTNLNFEDSGQVLMQMGFRIRKLREAMGKSSRQFAKICKIDNSKLCKIENGKVNVTILMLHQICTALEISPSRFWDIEALPQGQIVS